MALTSGEEAVPLSWVEPIVDMLCCERCLLMLFQPFADVLSVAEGWAWARSRAEEEVEDSCTIRSQ